MMRSFSLAALFMGSSILAIEPLYAQTKEVNPALRRQIHHAMRRGLGALTGGPITDLATRGRRRASKRPSDGLCLYAALHAGASRYDKLIRAASDSLARQKIRRTYEAACAIMALDRSDAGAYRSSIEDLAGFLENSQVRGAWGYPGSEDLSNTQYATLGLWTAHKSGVTVKRRVWEKLAAALPDFQADSGGFGYSRHGTDGTVSMTAAGIACAEICVRMLGEKSGSKNAWSDDELHGLRVVEARALEWMADAFDAGKGTRIGPVVGISLYALYGTERAAELTGTQRLGTHDWYKEGALSLVGTQSPEGLWGGSDPDGSNTSFALLFLSRATREVSAPLSGPRSSAPKPVLSLEEGLEADPATKAFETALRRLHRRDLGRNLVPLMKPRFAPSKGVAGHKASLLADTRRNTWWAPLQTDRAADLKISFENPKSVDTILISSPLKILKTLSTDPEGGPTPMGSRRLVIRVNGRPYPVLMPRDTRRKARLELAEPVTLKTLELIQIDEAGSAPGARLLIGEVEAQLR